MFICVFSPVVLRTQRGSSTVIMSLIARGDYVIHRPRYPW